MDRGLARLLLTLACSGGLACGGAVPDNLGPAGSSDADTTPPHDASATTHDASAPEEASTVEMEASVVDVAAPVDVSTAVETGPPPGPTVSCPMGGAAANCAAGAYCCITGEDDPMNETDTCTAASNACSGTTVKCAVPDDCPGQICCGLETDTTGYPVYEHVECAASCGDMGDVPFCASSSDCPSTRPNCQPSQILLGYNVCN